MANKRQLKKQIRTVCGDLAGECILASELIPGTDSAAFARIIGEIARVQEVALSRVSFVYDKNTSAFDTPAAYKAAKEKFFAAAMDKLVKDFSDQIQQILKQMNALLTKEQRELNKEVCATD